jgi:hypothetical protein
MTEMNTEMLGIGSAERQLPEAVGASRFRYRLLLSKILFCFVIPRHGLFSS